MASLRSRDPPPASRANRWSGRSSSSRRSSRSGSPPRLTACSDRRQAGVPAARRRRARRIARERARPRRRHQDLDAASALRLVGGADGRADDSSSTKAGQWTALITPWTLCFRTSATPFACACARRASPRSRFSRWRSASAPTPRFSPSSTPCCSSRCRSAIRRAWSCCGRPTRGGPGAPNVARPGELLRAGGSARTAFERMAPFYDYAVNLTGSGEPEELIAQDVTPRFLSDARRAAARRPDVRARREARTAGTRVAVLELRPLAAALRRRPGDRRTHDSAQRPPDHRHRRDAGRHAAVREARLAHRQADGPVAAVCVPASAAHGARALHERDRAAEARRPRSKRRRRRLSTIAGGPAGRAPAVQHRLGRARRADARRALRRHPSGAARARPARSASCS